MKHGIEVIEAPTHPALVALAAFWRGRCAGGRPPPRSAVDPKELRSHLPYLYLFEALPAQRDFRARLIGTAVVSARGHDMTGRLLSDILASSGDALAFIREALCRCLREEIPVFLRGATFWIAGKEFRRFESVYLPLTDERGGPGFVLGATHYDDLG